MMRSTRAVVLAITAGALVWGNALAIPTFLQYQGRLTDANGNTLNTEQTVTFSIYTDSLGIAPPVWSEIREHVTLVSGLFSITLGMGVPIQPSMLDHPHLFLGIKVSPDASDMLPRQRISSVASAIQVADNAVTGAKVVDGSLTPADFLPVIEYATSSTTMALGGAYATHPDAFITMVAPGPGYIVVDANVVAQGNTGSASSIQLHVGIATASNGTPANSHRWATGVSAQVNFEVGGTVHAVFQIPAAGTYSYYLVGRATGSGVWSSEIRHSNMTGIYYYRP